MYKRQYVTFTIQPKQDVELYTVIENKAHIQFDYNDYIITNNTEIYIGSDRINGAEPFIFLYPNPTSDFVKIHLIDVNQELIEMESMEVYDISGRPIEMKYINNVEYLYDASPLPSTVYILKIKSIDGEVYHSRLVRR